MTDWLLPLLRCPVCDRELTYQRTEDAAEGFLEHSSGTCAERYPVIGGIPRLLAGGRRSQLIRTQPDSVAARIRGPERLEDPTVGESDDPIIAGFDDEWRRFDEVGTRDQADVYELYFDLLPPDVLSHEQTVLDAGCGAGRWAFAISKRGPRVVAIDLGRSVELARSNTDPARVGCVQADLDALPLGAETVDWAYSLGVLHHMRMPERALADVVNAVRPGGVVVLYLYYALDERGPLFRAIFRVVDVMRQVVSQQPRFVIRAVSGLIAALVYWPLARAAVLLERIGAGRFATRLPLAFYRRLSFRTMLNDSVDRFGTRLERRYTRAQMTRLMEGAGLVDVVLSGSPPFWHGMGTKPLTRASPD